MYKSINNNKLYNKLNTNNTTKNNKKIMKSKKLKSMN